MYALVKAAFSHNSGERKGDSDPLELEQLAYFAGADASISSPARLVSAATIEERVKADTADACAAAESLVKMDEMLIQARSRLDGMIRS
jgi:hypothetical protein